MHGHIARGTAEPTPTLKLTRIQPFVRKYGGDAGGGGQEFEVVANREGYRRAGCALQASCRRQATRALVGDGGGRECSGSSSALFGLIKAPSPSSIAQLLGSIRTVCEMHALDTPLITSGILRTARRDPTDAAS